MTLEVLTSGLLSQVAHGFFTRKGGASSGVFRGLNCGYGSSDQSDIVTINRERVARHMEIPPDHLATVHQVHSAKVAVLDEAPGGETRTADAMVTATPGLALGVLTADCQPVLFADGEAGVIGAAHAGWKGAKSGVLEATIDAMAAKATTGETWRAPDHRRVGDNETHTNKECAPEEGRRRDSRRLEGEWERGSLEERKSTSHGRIAKIVVWKRGR